MKVSIWKVTNIRKRKRRLLLLITAKKHPKEHSTTEKPTVHRKSRDVPAFRNLCPSKESGVPAIQYNVCMYAYTI